MARNQEDLIMKRAMTVFAEQAVAYFGEIKKVKGVAPTELVDLEILEKRMDYVFLMDDETYSHFEFQTTDKRLIDLARFNVYDAVLYNQTQKQVYTYVIYSGDITNPLSGYSNGFSDYKVKVICMADQDADKILTDIENKLEAGITLSDKEILDLIFIPIMGGTLTKEDKIVRALTISNNYSFEKKEDIQSMLYTFALKFLDSSQLGKVKEVIMMTDLGRMIKEEGIKEGVEKGIEKAKLDIARELLLEKVFTNERIAKISKLSLEKVEELEKELTAVS